MASCSRPIAVDDAQVLDWFISPVEGLVVHAEGWVQMCPAFDPQHDQTRICALTQVIDLDGYDGEQPTTLDQVEALIDQDNWRLIELH